MMTGFQSKLVMAAALAMFLLVGDLWVSSALHQNDAEKSSWWVPGCRSISRKTVSSQKDCILLGSLDKHGKKTTVPFQSLRSSLLSPPPPSSTKARQTSIRSSAPPPPPEVS